MALKKLLIASSNPGKVREMELYLMDTLIDLDMEIIDLRSFPEIKTPEETGTTFIENALLKARYYYKQTGIKTLADDSGIVVAALDGRPGVYSAQYGATDDEKCENMLDELEHIRWDNRNADQISVLALVGAGIEEVFVGVVSGKITKSRRGINGFGYDSIFEDEKSGKTFAELTVEEKNSVSHRGKSLNHLRRFLVGGVK
jgi:XTP/dITP diphosphohydrolase